MCVLLRRRGEWTPPEMRQYLKQDSTVCLKKGMVQIFTLKEALDQEVCLSCHALALRVLICSP